MYAVKTFFKSYWIEEKNTQVPKRNNKENGCIIKRQWDSQTCQVSVLLELGPNDSNI